MSEIAKKFADKLKGLNPRVDGAFLCHYEVPLEELNTSLNPRVDGAFLCPLHRKLEAVVLKSQSPC